MDARVGIIVPAYNAERFLVATLDSVLTQSEASWRCVIVDDGSKDSTASIAQTYVDRDPRFTLVKQANAGVSRARTVGLQAIGEATEFLIFLDADDAWEPFALARLLDALATAPDAPAVHGLATFMDGDGKPIDTPTLAGRLQRLVLRDRRIIEPSKAEPTTPQMLATWPCVITPGVVLIRRSAWARSGGWDASLSIGEDWELWYRLSLQSPLAFVAEPLIRFRVYGTSSSSNWRRPFKLAKARAKVLSAGTPDQQRAARAAFRAMSRRLGFTRIQSGLASICRLRVGAGAKGIAGGVVNLAMSVRP